MDRASLIYLRTHLHNRPIETAMIGIGAAADHGAIWMAIGAALAVRDRQRGLRWIAAGGLAPVGILLNYPFKRLIHRRRPDLGLERLGATPSEHSFPSSHAVASFAAATGMAALEPSFAPHLYGLAGLVSVGRPYLGMHYPSDAVVGASYGVIIGLAGRRILRDVRLGGPA